MRWRNLSDIAPNSLTRESDFGRSVMVWTVCPGPDGPLRPTLPDDYKYQTPDTVFLILHGPWTNFWFFHFLTWTVRSGRSLFGRADDVTWWFMFKVMFVLCQTVKFVCMTLSLFTLKHYRLFFILAKLRPRVPKLDFKNLSTITHRVPYYLLPWSTNGILTTVVFDFCRVWN